MTANTEPREPSRAAGGCVLVVLVGAVTAAVFAASPTAGVLAVLAVGTAALWWVVRRPVSDSSATPPPRGATPTGDVLAGETGEVARVVYGREGVTCTIHPVREEVTDR